MPILNYTTKIDAHKTVAEIQKILAKGGAASIKTDYDNGFPVAISFLASIGERLVPFRLPADFEGVRLTLARDPNVPRALKSMEQAQRVAWRVVKDWTEAQMAFIQAGQATLSQLFLPHALNNDTGKTFYEEVASNPRFLLGSGENHG